MKPKHFTFWEEKESSQNLKKKKKKKKKKRKEDFYIKATFSMQLEYEDKIT